MLTVIAGSRGIIDYTVLCTAVQESGFTIVRVLSGGARGVDRLGERWAAEHGLPWLVMPADWDRNGRAAGLIRNCEMAQIAGQAIVLWDGHSRGTAHMIEQMRQLNKPVHVKIVNLHLSL